MAFSATGRMTAPAIVIRVRPLEETRTPNSGCVWLAECEVEGRRFEAPFRHGAVNALARELMAAGFADRPLEVHSDGVAGCLRWGSVAAAARRAYTRVTGRCNASVGSLRRMPCRLSERGQSRGVLAPAAPEPQTLVKKAA